MFTRIAIVSAICLLMLGVGCVASLPGYYNRFIAQEKGLTAQYSQNQNNYDAMVKTVRETAQVSTIYAADFEKVFRAAIEGRYGENGSQAVLQFITEQNPQLDARLYIQIQQAIEAGRRSFQNEQKLLLDKKQQYEIALGQFPSNIIAGLFGFPKIDLSKIDIVTSVATADVFKTKQAEEIKVR